ncbi:hypothetical protein [Pandoraea cepalis]|uniref:hypothetical protein n=1 Tax=Pandoraea cepalis TaxID=2508294 RepID=UPI00263B6025|nr:hypothetical protein [Pandoraea cepalis]
MTDNNKSTRQTLIRFPITIYTTLVKVAAEESVKRGKTVSVQTIVIETIEEWLKKRKLI